MNGKNNELFSERLSAGGRTYFFDIKSAQNGSKYLTICETRRKKENEFERQRIMVFEDSMDDFFKALGKTWKWYQNNAENNSVPDNSK